MAYVGADHPLDEGCVFCAAAAAERNDFRSRLVLAKTDHCIVMLNRYPYNNAHLLILPKEHLGDPADCSDDALFALSRLVRDSVGILREVLTPDGFNVGLNLGDAAGAGIVDHFHFHIVPRWNGDTNFMPVLGDVRVIPEHLEATWNRLRPEFERLESKDGTTCPE